MSDNKYTKLAAIVVVGLMVLKFAPNSPDQRTPIEVAKAVADKIIKESTFGFKLVPQKSVLGVQVVDLGQTFGHQKPGVGYALSYIMSEADTSALFGLSSSDGVKIWMNDQLVFRRADSRPAHLREIAYNRFVFQDTFQVKLHKGANKILVKVASSRNQLIFFLRTVTPEGEEETSVEFSLEPIAPEIKSSNWLCIGPFEGPAADNFQKSLEVIYPPERELVKFYEYGNKIFGWTVPKQNILLELIIKPTNSYQKGSYVDWHYANGATMLAILTVADETGEQRYRDFVRRYCDFTLRNFDYFKWQYESLHAFRGSFHRLFRRSMLDDTGAAALPFLELSLHENQSEYRKLIESMADYISHQQVRLEDGTFCRPEPIPYTVWADDLFMSVPFLLRMAEMTGEQSYFEDAVLQIYKFTELLFDSEKGLFYHGWFSPTHQTSAAHWGRANGWVVWAMSEALIHLPENYPSYKNILNIFRRHIEGLARFQDASGMWHQVLDHPESYEETSCTAMFVLAMARGVRNGWLEKKYQKNALKGWVALKTKIDLNGTVHRICTGTGIGNDLEFYFDRPTFDHDPRGLGAVIIAGLEVSKLEN